MEQGLTITRIGFTGITSARADASHLGIEADQPELLSQPGRGLHTSGGGRPLHVGAALALLDD
ncbi:hypothetical protein ACN3XK_72770, partial [Actinomadura welshii]